MNAIFKRAGHVNNQYLKSRLKGPHLQQLLLNSSFHPRIHHVAASEENILNQHLLKVLWVPRQKWVLLYSPSNFRREQRCGNANSQYKMENIYTKSFKKKSQKLPFFIYIFTEHQISS